jgi:hypothetical protein
MSHVAVHPEGPGPAPLEKLKEHELGLFTGNESTQFAMHPAKNPNEKGSFGFVETFVTIDAERPFVDGLLTLRFNSRNLGLVVRESLHLFYWNEAQ